MKYRWLKNVVTNIELDGEIQQLYQGLVFEVAGKDNKRIKDYLELGGWLEVVEEKEKSAKKTSSGQEGS